MVEGKDEEGETGLDTAQLFGNYGEEGEDEQDEQDEYKSN